MTRLMRISARLLGSYSARDLLRWRRGWAILLLCIGVCGAAALADRPYVVRASGEKVVGAAVRANDEGEILLTTDRGVVITFPAGTRAVVARPSALDRALQLMQAGNHRRAVPVLEDLVEEYRYLGWDREALRLLARAHAKQDNHADAVQAYERLFAMLPTARSDGEDLLRYLKAVEGTGDADKLAQESEKAIQDGPRECAAWAQLARARTLRAAGDVKAALIDYLRTAFFFRKQEAYIPEALYGAAICLERLGDDRAEDYYRRVIDEFPKSSYASEARQR